MKVAFQEHNKQQPFSNVGLQAAGGIQATGLLAELGQ
jgi:hypothetical protein